MAIGGARAWGVRLDTVGSCPWCLRAPRSVAGRRPLPLRVARSLPRGSATPPGSKGSAATSTPSLLAIASRSGSRPSTNQASPQRSRRDSAYGTIGAPATTTTSSTLGNVTLANLEALARIRADRDGWWIGAEGFGCELADADDEAGTQRAIDARDMQQAVWDLHFGSRAAWVASRLTSVVSEPVLQRLADLAPFVPADRVVAGHDIYPVSVATHGTRSERPLTIADRVDAYEAEARAWYERYQRPFWVAETSNLGLPVGHDGMAWLSALTGGIDRLVDAGLPARYLLVQPGRPIRLGQCPDDPDRARHRSRPLRRQPSGPSGRRRVRRARTHAIRPALTARTSSCSYCRTRFSGLRILFIRRW